LSDTSSFLHPCSYSLSVGHTVFCLDCNSFLLSWLPVTELPTIIDWIVLSHQIPMLKP
jgi:hypothetical protein